LAVNRITASGRQTVFIGTPIDSGIPNPGAACSNHAGGMTNHGLTRGTSLPFGCLRSLTLPRTHA